MLCLPEEPTVDDLIEMTAEFSALFHALSEEEFQTVHAYIIEVVCDFVRYMAEAMRGTLGAFLAESPEWARVGTEIMRDDASSLSVRFPRFTLGLLVERSPGRIVLHSLERRCAA